MMKVFYAFCFFTIIHSLGLSQNVGINTTGVTPNLSAMLDIVSSSQGLLIPRVALTSTTDASTISNGNVVSLLVYNTTAASSGSTAVYPGFYYWDGSQWVAFAGTGSKNWLLTGNAGTTVGTNFLGTTDDVDLQFNVNNVRSGLIDHANQQTFFGYDAGVASTAAGSLTTFIGHSSGASNTSGNANTALGYAALKNNTLANDNTAVGVDALVYLSGAGNTGMGSHVLEGFTTVAGNTGVYNTALGFAAGSGYSGTPNTLPITTGSYNTFLGYNTVITPGTLSNAVAIGANAEVTGNNAIVLGGINGINTATVSTNVGIGTTAPAQSLDIFSKFQVNSSGDAVKIKNVSYSWPSAQATVSGQVLSNDAAGNLSWTSVSSLLNGAVSTATSIAASGPYKSATPSVKTSLALAANATYILYFSAELGGGPGNQGNTFYQFDDGTTVFANGSGLTDGTISSAGDYSPIAYTLAYTTGASGATVNLKYYSYSTSYAAYIRNARITALRIQ